MGGGHGHVDHVTITLTTGGGMGKRCLFSVKSSTRKVAEDITILRGLPV